MSDQAKQQPTDAVEKALRAIVSKTVETYCFGCSKKRPCKAIGTYKYDGEAYNIYVCQWCRAETTKRKKRGLPC